MPFMKTTPHPLGWAACRTIWNRVLPLLKRALILQSPVWDATAPVSPEFRFGDFRKAGNSAKQAAIPQAGALFRAFSSFMTKLQWCFGRRCARHDLAGRGSNLCLFRAVLRAKHIPLRASTKT
jgi:hypothetical protein